MKQRTGAAATLAIICAVLGFVFLWSGQPFKALFLYALAIVAGGTGFTMAASPRVGGGALSLGAIGLSVVGVILAILVWIGLVLF